jgi:hypothetical protein
MRRRSLQSECPARVFGFISRTLGVTPAVELRRSDRESQLAMGLRITKLSPQYLGYSLWVP